MTLIIPPQDREQLLANGRRRVAGEETDPRPVLKLFTPDAAATWLLTELDPEDPDLAFGLCDLGLGSPELGYVRISEIASCAAPLVFPLNGTSASGRIGRSASTRARRSRLAGSSPDRQRGRVADGAAS